jgi:chromosome partitioning protein
MRAIAFASQKGGCGKTTSCLNIAAIIAQDFDSRVLIVDLDSNACASRTFDVVADLAGSVGGALLGQRSLASIVRPTVLPRLWLAPGSTELHVLERYTPADSARVASDGRLTETALATELETVANEFDYVLIDCPGGHAFMQHAALLACDEVVIPTGLSAFDLFGATPTLQLIAAARCARGGELPKLIGLLLNGAGKHGPNAKTRDLLAEIPEFTLTPIRHSALLRTITVAPRIEQRVIAVARPEHPASLSYRQAAREIVLGIEAARSAVHATDESVA